MRIRAGFKARFLLNNKSEKHRTALDLLLFGRLVIVQSTLPFALCRKLPVEKKQDCGNRLNRKKMQKRLEHQGTRKKITFNTGCIQQDFTAM